MFDSFYGMCEKGNISQAGSPFCFAHRLFNQSNHPFFPLKCSIIHQTLAEGHANVGKGITMERRRGEDWISLCANLQTNRQLNVHCTAHKERHSLKETFYAVSLVQCSPCCHYST